MAAMSLPIDAILPDLIHALAKAGRAVVQAPPGAGKTTGIPLALLDHIEGRILMLEPRRLAARAASAQMARMSGTELGTLTGYRVRGESVISRTARIEVVTEGILTRMLQNDPDLPGIGAVIFDEFHERSLQADLGLAMVLDVRDTLRPDLRVIVMSATLDAAPVAALMGGAPILTSAGRSYPVETRWLDRPLPKGTRWEKEFADLIARVVQTEPGSALAFLPGEAEIRRVANMLAGRLPSDMSLHPLYGNLPFTQQQAALQPVAQGRKLVLASAIAETSLTIEGVRLVFDAGLARRSRFDPGTGMARLVTERVTRAEADQRRGRAGRTEPGLCLRLWARSEEGGLPPFAPPEIERADLAAFALDLAAWGDSADLRLLTPPPTGALTEARALLQMLGALDQAGRITPHGRAMAALPLHPRLAHMLLCAGKNAAELATLLSERDILRGGTVDLTTRLRALHDADGVEADHPVQVDRVALARLRPEIKRLRALVSAADQDFTAAEMAALAYPDRIGLRRDAEDGRFLLSGGNGVVVDAADPLSQARMIVVTDTDGAARDARVRQAIALAPDRLAALFSDQITRQKVCRWSRRLGRIDARVQDRFGALVLSDAPWPDAPPQARVAALADGLRAQGLPWSDAARRFAARVSLLRAQGAELPALEDAPLLEQAEHWLAPWLVNCRTADDLRAIDLLPGLRAMLDWAQSDALERLAPAHFTTPLGNKVPIDYSGDAPEISVRLQELFGMTQHPVIGPARVPLRLVLLSPARRPIQVTMDLPGFWRSSYADVRKDMRGQYPKHPWPEDPSQATPTLRAKPRAEK
jgi:ATP-dependent helicase HrpB